jgi:hypothetical protein
VIVVDGIDGGMKGEKVVGEGNWFFESNISFFVIRFCD